MIWRSVEHDREKPVEGQKVLVAMRRHVIGIVRYQRGYFDMNAADVPWCTTPQPEFWMPLPLAPE